MSQNQIDQALKISALLKKYLQDELTLSERHELEKWLQEHPQNREHLRKMMEQGANNAGLSGMFNTSPAFDKLMERIKEPEVSLPRTKQARPFYKLAAAAMVLMALTAGLLIFNKNKKNDKANPLQLSRVSPKQSNIQLTLANGKKVNLETQGTGVIATQGQAVITKRDSNLLSYQLGNQTSAGDASIAVNKLDVPRGKQFQLVLPDGSKVWLNAETTLSFPSSFDKGERVVELTGEAYFEVAHFSAWSFKVKTKEQTVEVLGTHFNISAYADEPRTTTTLASGRVRVFDGSASSILKPGQFAVKNNGKGGFEIATADLEENLGWKNGLLVFKDATIEEIMQTVSRAYDVEINVDPQVRSRHFGGTYPVKSGLNNLLRSLEQTNMIHFKNEGRRVSIMP